jgi:hypothetical protein
MKTFQVRWKLSSTEVTVKVIVMTGREERMVEHTALWHLKLDGIFIDATRLPKPTITLVESEQSVTESCIGEIN